MAGRGGYQIMNPTQLAKFLALQTPDDRIEYWDSECYSEDTYFDLDKAWDAIHRCLGEYPPGVEFFETALIEAHGSEPLKLAILGGRPLISLDESEWWVYQIEPQQLGSLSEAMAAIDEQTLSQKYWHHCRGAWPEYGEEDREYTWAYFQEARDFLAKQIGTGNSVLFIANV